MTEQDKKELKEWLSQNMESISARTRQAPGAVMQRTQCGIKEAFTWRGVRSTFGLAVRGVFYIIVIFVLALSAGNDVAERMWDAISRAAESGAPQIEENGASAKSLQPKTEVGGK